MWELLLAHFLGWPRSLRGVKWLAPADLARRTDAVVRTL